MPRPKKIRRVNNPPHFKGFRPIGISGESQPVILNFEEYESIRLSDLELYGQVQAAGIMQVSRPTFARIYESARRKVARAFAEGRPIIFEGGKVYFNSEWYFCRTCNCWFNHPDKEQEVKNCGLCSGTDIEQYNDDPAEPAGTGDRCICPKCGKEKAHEEGIPCRKEFCPECHSPMKRKSGPHFS